MTILGPFSSKTHQQLQQVKKDHHEAPPSPSSASTSAEKWRAAIPSDGLMAAHGWSTLPFPQQTPLIPGHPLQHDPNEIMAAHGWSTSKSQHGKDEKEARRHNEIKAANVWSKGFWEDEKEKGGRVRRNSF